MTDAVSGKTALSYVGSRPYIRGADLYDWFERQLVAAMPAAARPVTLRQFRLVREVERDGAWMEGAGSGASATIETLDPSGTARQFAFHETGDVIRARVPDVPSQVRNMERNGDFAGGAVLAAPRSNVALLNGLIEVNKRLHAETLVSRGMGADHIRLIFIENLSLSAERAGDCAVVFRHLGERRTADRTYTLNAVCLDGGEADLRICYSY